MEPIRSELLAIWTILLLALLVAVTLLVRPVRECINCVPLLSCIFYVFRTIYCAVKSLLEALFCWLLSEVLCDLYNSAKTTIRCLAFEWYPMAALSVVPICWDIPREGAVVFLAVYCVAGMLVCSVEPKKKKCVETKTDTELGSEFFMGMKIKIDLD